MDDANFLRKLSLASRHFCCQRKIVIRPQTPYGHLSLVRQNIFRIDFSVYCMASKRFDLSTAYLATSSNNGDERSENESVLLWVVCLVQTMADFDDLL
ncbi:hypothetical protein NPIL_98971 [Nephila pilipes]|uniref:Uncharacterized protein n=1 Tax=Nephila pilipes TaxID=299642 RepID=A0A8X6UMU1_NEPPI|nr:hypothetical protein NPIL_98971 [Nephila pilipes]